MKQKYWKGALVFLMLGALILILTVEESDKQRIQLRYTDFWHLAENGRVSRVKIGSGEDWQVELSDGSRALTPNPRAADGKERLLQLDIEVTEMENTAPGGIYAALLLGGMLLLIRARGKGAMGLQKYAAVQANESIPDITFDDVAVAEETLQSMRDLVGFLQQPGQYSRYGARMPKGVMLYGPPGTGKTLLARALAGEAKTPFFAMSGADFVQVYVGVGASRVREIFKKARKAGGGVIFIDEIDAIGKKRDSGNEEREQTLNALLTEMSGFSGGDGILVLAATNRLDTLDAALLREGRFDRRIEVNLPDYEARLRILQVHARKKPLASGISLEKIARQTTLFSGAQLETLLNEAAIRAARRKREMIGEEELEDAFCAVTVGEEIKKNVSPEEKKITAYHEAGHALITRCMMPDAEIQRLTIIPSARGAAGYSMSIQPDRLLHTKGQLMAMMCAALGGRAAEEMLLGMEGITTGAAGDLKKVREIAACMAREWGMGASGDETQDERNLEKEAMEKARDCLKKNKPLLDRLAQHLLEKETLRADEILSLTEGAIFS